MSDHSAAGVEHSNQSPEQLEVAAWFPPLIEVIKRRSASNDQGIELLQRYMAELGTVFNKMLEQQTLNGKKKAKRRLKRPASAAELDRYRDERLETTIWQGTARELANMLRTRGYQALADRIGNDVDTFWLPDGSEGRTDDSLKTREDGQDYLTRESAALRSLLRLLEDIANEPAERLSPNSRALLVRQEPVSEETQARLTVAELEHDAALMRQAERLGSRTTTSGSDSTAAVEATEVTPLSGKSSSDEAPNRSVDRQEGADDGPHPDGPEPPRSVWLNGQKKDVRRRSFQLLVLFWPSRKTTATRAELVAIWEAPVGDQAFATAASRFNAEMPPGFPFTLHWDGTNGLIYKTVVEGITQQFHGVIAR
jgi:hypothetical protein